MEVPIDTSKMSDQELQFHYFKMHDSDQNNKLGEFNGLQIHGKIKNFKFHLLQTVVSW